MHSIFQTFPLSTCADSTGQLLVYPFLVGKESSMETRATHCSLQRRRHSHSHGSRAGTLTSSEEPFSTLNLPARCMAPSASLEMS